MNGIIVVDELTDDVEGSVVLIVGDILAIEQRLIAGGRVGSGGRRGRARRGRGRDRTDGLERVLEHDRVGVLGRKLDGQFERLLADVGQRAV